MINPIRFSEYNPIYWDEEFETYRNDIENWRNYQIEDLMYNPYTRDDLNEQRMRDYYRGYEEEVSILDRNKLHYPARRFEAPVKGRIQKVPAKPEQSIHRHHRIAKEPHYPQRGNTDPYSGQSWVY
jgi:hypothetical protein